MIIMSEEKKMIYMKLLMKIVVSPPRLMCRCTIMYTY